MQLVSTKKSYLTRCWLKETNSLCSSTSPSSPHSFQLLVCTVVNLLKEYIEGSLLQLLTLTVSIH